MLNFGSEDILAFEEVHSSSSGELQEIHITLKDGSHSVYKEMVEICEVLDVLKELKNRAQTAFPALPKKRRRFGLF